MPSYGLKQVKYVDYVAMIRTNSGNSAVEHIRVSFGAKAAYASIAKHWEGEGKIQYFHSHDQMTAFDRDVVAQNNPGLVTNIWHGFEGP